MAREIVFLASDQVGQFRDGLRHLARGLVNRAADLHLRIYRMIGMRHARSARIKVAGSFGNSCLAVRLDIAVPVVFAICPK